MILLVEDNDQLRVLLAEVLRADQLVVVTAASADEALRRASEQDGALHLVIADLSLGSGSGWQLVEAIRGRSGRPDLPALIISGFPEDATKREWAHHAGSAFLQKPVLPEVLLERVHAMLGDEARSGSGDGSGGRTAR